MNALNSNQVQANIQPTSKGLLLNLLLNLALCSSCVGFITEKRELETALDEWNRINQAISQKRREQQEFSGTQAQEIPLIADRKTNTAAKRVAKPVSKKTHDFTAKVVEPRSPAGSNSPTTISSQTPASAPASSPAPAPAAGTLFEEPLAKLAPQAKFTPMEFSAVPTNLRLLNIREIKVPQGKEDSTSQTAEDLRWLRFFQKRKDQNASSPKPAAPSSKNLKKSLVSTPVFIATKVSPSQIASQMAPQSARHTGNMTTPLPFLPEKAEKAPLIFRKPALPGKKNTLPLVTLARKTTPDKMEQQKKEFFRKTMGMDISVPQVKTMKNEKQKDKKDPQQAKQECCINFVKDEELPPKFSPKTPPPEQQKPPSLPTLAALPIPVPDPSAIISLITKNAASLKKEGKKEKEKELRKEQKKKGSEFSYDDFVYRSLPASVITTAEAPKVSFSGNLCTAISATIQDNSTYDHKGDPHFSFVSADLTAEVSGATSKNFKYRGVANLEIIPSCSLSVNEAFLEVSGNIGTFQLGNVKGVEGIIIEDATHLLGGADGVDGILPYLINLSPGLPNTHHLMGYTKRATKVSFYSPRWAGCQIAIDVCPNPTHMGWGDPGSRDYAILNWNDNNVMPSNLLKKRMNVAWGINFQQQINDFTLRTAFVAVREKVSVLIPENKKIESENIAAKNFIYNYKIEREVETKRSTAIQFSGSLRYKNFHIAGGFLDNGSMNLPAYSSDADYLEMFGLAFGDSGKGWNIGGKISLGCIDIALTQHKLQRQVKNNSYARATLHSLTVDCQILSGLTFFVEINHVQTQADKDVVALYKGSVEKNKGTSILIGPKLTF